jgi:hypothetical protein
VVHGEHVIAIVAKASRPCALMARSVVRLPRDVAIYADFEVYVNGVLQRSDVDFSVDGRALIFDRALREDSISRWRWFLGAWGVGTYRQDDTVDVRYEADGEMRLRHGLPITLVDDEDE